MKQITIKKTLLTVGLYALVVLLCAVAMMSICVFVHGMFTGIVAGCLIGVCGFCVCILAAFYLLGEL